MATATETPTTAATETAATTATETAPAAAVPAPAAADAPKTDTTATAETGRTDGDTPKAPEKYDLRLPDGAHLDPSDLADLEKAFRTAELTNEEAQARLTAINAELANRATVLLAQAQADPTYGGEKFARSQQLAKAVIDQVRPVGHPRREAFTRLLDKSGVGNHIEVLSFLADLGAATAEDTPVTGSTTPTAKKSAAQVFWPEQAKSA